MLCDKGSLETPLLGRREAFLGLSLLVMEGGEGELLTVSFTGCSFVWEEKRF